MVGNITTYRRGRYHIYEISKSDLQMIDTNIDTHNPMFEAVQVTNTR
jgi:hypothetical protein